MTIKSSLSVTALALTMTAGAFVLAPASASAETGDIFEAMDTDGDGIVTQAEFEAHLAEQPRREARAERRAGGMWRHAGSRFGHGPMTGMDEEGRAAFATQMIERFDTDGDGALSEAEIIAALEHMAELRNDPEARARAMFERIDTTGDGMISPEEFEAAHAQMRERGEAMRAQRGKSPRQWHRRHGPQSN